MMTENEFAPSTPGELLKEEDFAEELKELRTRHFCRRDGAANRRAGEPRYRDHYNLPV
jgi:hypothetical protein